MSCAKRTHPGRPPLDDQNPSVHLSLSLSSKELAVYTERAKAARLKNAQEWIRRTLRLAADPNKSL